MMVEDHLMTIKILKEIFLKEIMGPGRLKYGTAEPMNLWMNIQNFLMKKNC
jgi:hypothetical protein